MVEGNKYLFSASHARGANLLAHATDAGMDETGMNNGEVLLAKIRALGDGKTAGAFMNQSPRWCVVPRALRIDARRMIESPQIVIAGTAAAVTKIGTMNPMYNEAQVIPEAELDQYSEVGYYLAANQANRGSLVLVRLIGSTGPVLIRTDSAGIDGVQFLFYEDVNIGANGWDSIVYCKGEA
jgi:hypothetical protein